MWFRTSQCLSVYNDRFKACVEQFFQLEQQNPRCTDCYEKLYRDVVAIIAGMPDECPPADRGPFHHFREFLVWRLQSDRNNRPKSVPKYLHDAFPVFGKCDTTEAGTILDVIWTTPVCPIRYNLTQQMSLMLPGTRRWLVSLGRNAQCGPEWTETFETTEQCNHMEMQIDASDTTMAETKSDTQVFRLDNTFELTGAQVNALRRQARYSVAVTNLAPKTTALEKSALRDAVYLPAKPNGYDYESVQERIKKDAEETTLSQFVAVTGPVYVMFNNDFEPQECDGRPIVVVSVPGMNFIKTFPDHVRYVQTDPQTKALSLLPDKVGEIRDKIRCLIHHALLRFQTFGVTAPVLCAIGCGAFASRIPDVPKLYAEAMAALLSRNRYGFTVVVISLMTMEDHATFRTAFEAVQGRLVECQSCVVLTLYRSMIHIADRLARRGQNAGMLNPSDPLAVRSGYLGMYFERVRYGGNGCGIDNGNARLEEIVALQTTLLLHHKGSNPTLYTDIDRFKRTGVDRRSAHARRATRWT